jgi:hypothetical protein
MLGGYGEVAYDVMPLAPGSEMTRAVLPLGVSRYAEQRAERLRRRSPVQAADLRARHSVEADSERRPEVDYRNVDDREQGGDQVDFGFGLVF